MVRYGLDQDTEMEAVSQETKLIQMRLRSRTLDSLRNIQNLTGISNRTQIIATAIQLTDIITQALSEDGKLCVEHKDGTKEYITLVGL